MTSSHTAALSLVILTEDSGKDGHATVEALIRRMLHLVVPGYSSHRINFASRSSLDEEAMRGNVWKSESKNPVERDRQIRLLRYIGTHLSQPNTFVLFHTDGDRPWETRTSSENASKFERLIRSRLPLIAERGRANNARTRQISGRTESHPGLRVEHLLLVCPFRSIEAWLFQNLKTAVAICGREHQGEHIAELRTWEQHRDALDELSAPEDSVCLHKKFNLELASSAFPAREAYDVKKSFAETVDRLIGCEALRHALELTRM